MEQEKTLVEQSSLTSRQGQNECYQERQVFQSYGEHSYLPNPQTWNTQLSGVSASLVGLIAFVANLLLFKKLNKNSPVDSLVFPQNRTSDSPLPQSGTSGYDDYIKFCQELRKNK